MQVILKHDVYQIKNGYAAHSPELGLTAHGYSPELAQRNLERITLCFFRPFERGGNLAEEIRLLNLKTRDGDENLSVSLANA